MRYYYDDPIKAAWMQRNFGFKYDQFRVIHPDDMAIQGRSSHPNSVTIIWTGLRRFYLNKDCHELLKPRMGDIGVSESGEVGKYNGVDWIQAEGCNDYGGGYHMDECVTIIQRESKCWFKPEAQA